MEFIKEIRLLENTTKRKEDYMTSLGSTEVLLTTLELAKSNDHYVEDEFLKAITRYVASYTDSSYFIKLRETSDDNLQKLQEYIEQNAIKLLIDINVTKDNNNDIIIKPINKYLKAKNGRRIQNQNSSAAFILADYFCILLVTYPHIL